MLILMSWKTTATLLLGIAAQGCSLIPDTSRREFERQAEHYMERAADRMARHEDLRQLAYEHEAFILQKDYENAAKRVYKQAGHAALKAAWYTFTDDTALEGIIEPSFTDLEGNRLAETNEPLPPAEKLKHASYKLGFTPVIRLGDTAGGGIKTKDGHALLLRGKDYWELKGAFDVEGVRMGGEYRDNEFIKDSHRFYIQKDCFSFSYEQGYDGKVFWIEFFK